MKPIKLVVYALFCLSTASCAVDETGYLVQSAIRYTSASPLSSVDRDIVVIGLPGALDSDAEAVTASNPRTGASAGAQVRDTSFVATLPARADDSIVLRSGQSEVIITLSDRLDTVTTPERCGNCAGFLYREVGDNQLVVVLSSLIDKTLPIMVYNQTLGASVLVTDADNIPPIAGGPGDTLCLVRLGPSQDAASANYCEEQPRTRFRH